MYSDKVIDHFQNPRNVGEIEDASGVGTVGNAKCGDMMRLYLKIIDNHIHFFFRILISKGQPKRTVRNLMRKSDRNGRNGRTDEKGDGAQRLSDRTDIEGNPVYQTDIDIRTKSQKTCVSP